MFTLICGDAGRLTRTGTTDCRDAGSQAGLGYTINLPVPAGSDDDLWLSLLEHVVLPAASAFRPELVLISAGFDAHRADPLGGCLLESSDYARMARHVRDLAQHMDAPGPCCARGRL
jgi:acetoin utilization deacetylase AcuC-like enzyme